MRIIETSKNRILQECRYHRWPKADHVGLWHGIVGDWWRVCLVSGHGRDIRYGAAFLAATRMMGEAEFINALVESGDRAYRIGWPPPLPPFRIGTRSPRRLKPASDADPGVVK